MARQTIEQIEARDAEVRTAERDAMSQLAELLRELAVELPPESRLPIRFAKTANYIDIFTTGPYHVMRTTDIDRLVNEWSLEEIEALIPKLESALREAGR